MTIFKSLLIKPTHYRNYTNRKHNKSSDMYEILFPLIYLEQAWKIGGKMYQSFKQLSDICS